MFDKFLSVLLVIFFCIGCLSFYLFFLKFFVWSIDRTLNKNNVQNNSVVSDSVENTPIGNEKSIPQSISSNAFA
jgi:hypothetical protein